MHTLTVADIGERALIDRITARLAMPSWVVVGPGDDAAVIEPERGALDVLTTDAQVEGVHFDRRFVPPDAIGHRALAVNLSDLAAMGATPRAALLSLALPDALDVGDRRQAARRPAGARGSASRRADRRQHHAVARAAGRSTSRRSASVRPRRVLTRAGRTPGDEVYVTGALGDAAVGLQMLQAAAARASLPSLAHGRRSCVDGICGPSRGCGLGMLLGRNRAASSCMDLSDGLAEACVRWRGVRVGITLDASAHSDPAEVREAQARRGRDPLEPALSGGDDYELFFTVRPAHRGRLRAVCQQLGDLPITRIGVVTKGRELLVRDEDGARAAARTDIEHFK